jgi:hypothetical protein
MAEAKVPKKLSDDQEGAFVDAYYALVRFLGMCVPKDDLDPLRYNSHTHIVELDKFSVDEFPLPLKCSLAFSPGYFESSSL